MIRISLLSAEVLLLGIWMAVRGSAAAARVRVDWKREALLLLMYVNLAVLLRITFFPMERLDGKVQPLVYEASAAYPFRINWIPFRLLLDYDSRRDMLLNLIGNTAAFIPTGIILPVLYPKLRKPGRTVAAGFLTSLGIEILQLPFSVRVSDMDDLILNTLGTAIGYGIYAGVRKSGRRSGKGTRETA